MSEISFDEQAVLDAARAATGLDDFGDPSFHEGLRALLETYDRNPFNERGRRRNHRRVVQLLSTRLRLEAAWKRHPEILERRIAQPMVLTGLPRSGTSALFNLLAADPAVRPLRLWEAVCPDPLEGQAPGAPDPRRDAIEAQYARGREKNPDFTKIHFASADTPEECVLIHAFAMNGVQLGVEIVMEPYGSWYRAQDLRPMYAYAHRIMQTLDWQRPGRRWLLKAPAHMWAIEALVETYPDVSIVWNHRDPVACMASACSMTAALSATREGLDPRELGPAVMEFYAESLDRGLAARDRLEAKRFFDVDYDALVADELAVVRGIYAHFGLPLDDAAERALAAWQAAHPPGRHGRHEYDLAQYGLTRERVLERFARYCARFGLAAS